MFQETSYGTKINPPKLAWQGRRNMRPQAIGATGGDDRFYVPGYGPGVVESPGFMAPGPPLLDYGGVTTPPPNVPAANAPTPGGLDLSSLLGSLTSLPWYVYAAAAYFLFFRKGRR